MQEWAVQAAVDGKSLLTIFPTGGGNKQSKCIVVAWKGENDTEKSTVMLPRLHLRR